VLHRYGQLERLGEVHRHEGGDVRRRVVLTGDERNLPQPIIAGPAMARPFRLAIRPLSLGVAPSKSFSGKASSVPSSSTSDGGAQADTRGAAQARNKSPRPGSIN